MDGPGLWTFTMTKGISADAAKPIASVIKATPPPDVPVADLAPV